MAAEDLYEVVGLIVAGTVVDLLRRVIEAIDALGLDLLAVIDYSGDAFDVGLAMPETKLVLFASPAAAARLTVSHPDLGLEFPLTMLIREQEDGNASLSYHAPAALAQRHGLTDDEAAVLRVVETIARAVRGTS